MKIWIFETEIGSALCEIERSAIECEFRNGFASVEVAVAAMGHEYPGVVPTIERLVQPELQLSGGK